MTIYTIIHLCVIMIMMTLCVFMKNALAGKASPQIEWVEAMKETTTIVTLVREGEDGKC